MDKQDIIDLAQVLDGYGLSTNPFKSTILARYLRTATPLRELLSDYNRLGIYKLYPYEFQLVVNSCKMVARSLQLAMNTDSIDLSRIVDATRLASPMISIDTEGDASWDWIKDDFIDMDRISRSEVALECFTSEWINKLGDKSLAEYYLTLGDKPAAEHLMTELWESVLYWKLVNTSGNPQVLFGALVLVHSRYTVVSAVTENTDLLSSTPDILIPATADRFKKGVSTTEYEELINKIK